MDVLYVVRQRGSSTNGRVDSAALVLMDVLTARR